MGRDKEVTRAVQKEFLLYTSGDTLYKDDMLTFLLGSPDVLCLLLLLLQCRT
jgi:hypothetical protein